MIIAIDGPAGSGKTTVAKLLAKKLNICRLDTGATYRALTLKALDARCDLHNSLSLKELAKSLDLKIEKEKIYLDGKEVTEALRTPLIDKNISLVVSHPEVREVMVALQRNLAASCDFVVEGRDITTVVFPNAEYKFYLDAAFEIRVQRRFQEVAQKKIDIGYKELSEDLRKRDEADKNRKTGPLRLSPDACYVDTTNLTIEGVVEELAAYIKK